MVAAAVARPSNLGMGEGVEVELSPLSIDDIIITHEIVFTTQRSGEDGRGQLVRRMCHIGADGCKHQCTTECQHDSCKERYNKSKNRYSGTYGIFICGNIACKLKHYNNDKDLNRVIS